MRAAIYSLSPKQEELVFDSCSFFLNDLQAATTEPSLQNFHFALSVALFIGPILVGGVQDTNPAVPLFCYGYNIVAPAVTEHAVVVIVVTAYKNSCTTTGAQTMEQVIDICADFQLQVELLCKGREINQTSGAAPLVGAAIIGQLAGILDFKFALIHKQPIGDHHGSTKAATGFCDSILNTDLAHLGVRI